MSRFGYSADPKAKKPVRPAMTQAELDGKPQEMPARPIAQGARLAMGMPASPMPSRLPPSAIRDTAAPRPMPATPRTPAMSQYELDTGKPDLDHDLNYSYPPFARKADGSMMPSRPPTGIGENPDLSRTVNRSDELQTAQLPFRPVPYGAKKDGNGNYGYGPFASKPTETWTQRPVPDRTPPATEPGKAGQMGALRVAESRMSQAMLDTGKPGPDEFPVTPAPARIDDATLNRNINGAPGQPGMVRQRDAIITQLQALGPAYLDSRVPGQAQRRAALIAQRQGLESLGSTMAAARTPAPSVTPTQAQVGRDNLTMKTGVDVRPAREKVLAMAADFANMGDTSNAAALEARALNGEWEQRDFRDRAEARQTRQINAQTALTTKDPATGRSPMEQVDFDRSLVEKKRAMDQAILDAKDQAQIRELEMMGKPDERTQIENDVLRAQRDSVVSQTKRDDAKAAREAANPLSAENAGRTIAERQAADSVSGFSRESAMTDFAGIGGDLRGRSGGITPGGIAPSFGEFLKNIFPPGMVANAVGSRVKETERKLAAFESVHVAPLEALAKLDPQTAAKDAAILLSQMPQPDESGAYSVRFLPRNFVGGSNYVRLAEVMTRVRARLSRIASTAGSTPA